MAERIVRWSGWLKDQKSSGRKADASLGMSILPPDELAKVLSDSGWHNVEIVRVGDGSTRVIAGVSEKDEYGRTTWWANDEGNSNDGSNGNTARGTDQGTGARQPRRPVQSGARRR